MELALEAAKAAELRGEVPVGAVLVIAQSGDIVASVGNRVFGIEGPHRAR